jgi:antibiotic biosynthesis monooxygenase (ABM) superfamily enzyme
MTNANFISHQFSNLCLYLCGMGINLKLHPVPGFRCGQSRLSLSTFVYSLSWMQYFLSHHLPKTASTHLRRSAKKQKKITHRQNGRPRCRIS